MKHRNVITLTELIIIFVIVFVSLMIILPVLYDHERPDYRVKCASQLRGLGNATAMYHNDFDGRNPIPWTDKVKKAGFGTGWYNAKGSNTYTRWYDPTWKDWDKQPTVGGCLFLLVKYEDVSPKAFVCPGDKDAEEMFLKDAIYLNSSIEDWSYVNDFQNGFNLSYSMNDPWENPLNASSPSDIAFLADKSNKFDTETFSERPHTGNSPNYKITGFWTDQGDKEGSDEGHGNSNNHNTEYQNVLFAGGHVERLETPTVGIEGDNIYTRWEDSVSPTDKKIGKWGKGLFSADVNDAYLGN